MLAIDLQSTETKATNNQEGLLENQELQHFVVQNAWVVKGSNKFRGEETSLLAFHVNLL